jgi:large subunit ribosomal protein L6
MAREKTVKIPAGVDVSLSGYTVTVKGPKGTVKKDLPPVKLTIENGSFKAEGEDKAAQNTASALVRSAVKGVTEGHQRRMQIIYAHFPMTIELKGKEIAIKNFLGEKIPRKAKIVGDTIVKVEKDILMVNGPDDNAVGQTVANIKTATKIKNKDSRVFQDGIYLVA